MGLGNMRTEKIKLDYEGLRWDGTIEGAREICVAIEDTKPSWDIRESPYSKFDEATTLTLTIVEILFGSGSRSWELKAGDLLACCAVDGTLRPERVIKAHEV